jgi:hypothetical protein
MLVARVLTAELRPLKMNYEAPRRPQKTPTYREFETDNGGGGIRTLERRIRR